jgi:hypothetical protein
MAARKNEGLELENGPFQASLFQAANRIFFLGKSSKAPSTEIFKWFISSAMSKKQGAGSREQTLAPARAAKTIPAR